MSYIGSSATPLPVAFSGVRTQSFNGTGSQTAFTLSRAVSAVTDIEVVVNNVQQSPYDSSYNISGATLTFSEAPSSGTNNIYVIFRDQPVGSLTDPTSVKKAGDTMTGDLVLDNGFADGAQVILKSAGNTDWNIDNYSGALRFYNGATVRAQIDALGRVTMPYQPAFHARGGPSQTGAQVVQFQTIQLNIGTHFSVSTHRFTAPIAGRYFFNAQALKDSSHADVTLALAKNSSIVTDPADNTGSGTYISLNVSAVLELAAGDYVTANVTNGNIYSGYRNFSGYLIG